MNARPNLDPWFYRAMPVVSQVAVCPDCGHRVLSFAFPGGGPVLWDPDRLQRRWARSLLSARDHATGPPWSWGFGVPHECPPRDDCPLAERAARRRRLTEEWEGGCDGL